MDHLSQIGQKRRKFKIKVNGRAKVKKNHTSVERKMKFDSKKCLG